MKGMYNQSTIIPEDSYIYALNMIDRNDTGSVGELQDEPGNQSCINIPSGYEIIGSIETPKKKTFLFLQDKINGIFKIWETFDCQHTEILSTDCFTYNNRVKGEYRLLNEDREMLYFYDGESPDRYFNLSEPQSACDDFLLKPNYLAGKITYNRTVESGGNLPVASYSIKARYVDKLGNYTDWFNETTPVPIFKISSEGSALNTPTSKALVYDLVLDESYPFVEIGVCKYTDESTVVAYNYGKFRITPNFSVSITSLDGLPFEDYEATNVNTAKYESSKAMVQQDNRLIRANLAEIPRDWGKFQQLANDIQTTWYIGDNRESGAKSFLRDEVYALGIIYVFVDGLESPPFHIPGREKDLDAVGNPLPTTEVNTHNRPAPTTGWDSSTYAKASYSDADIIDSNYFERWKLYNTAIQDTVNSCGYYEVQDLDGNLIDYPNDLDCDGNRIYPLGVIRHHRMPDSTLIPHFDSDGALPLHLSFGNISFPADVVGYKIVVGDRSADKTVLDKGIFTTILRQRFNQNIVDNVTNNNRDLREHFVQSMQFSHDNQSPKSYTLQTTENMLFTAGGEQTFMCLPACADNIAYSVNNSEQVNSYATRTALDVAGFHSPKAKYNGFADTGSHVKFEMEIYDSLTQSSGSSAATDSNDNFYVLNNRKKFKNRETKNILTTNVYYDFSKTWIPEELLTNRKIVNKVDYQPDSTFNALPELNGRWSFNNKTQQEISTFQLSGSNDELSESRQADELCTYGGTGGWQYSKYWWTTPSLYTKAYNFIPHEGIPDVRMAGGWMSHNYVSIKNYKTDCYRQLEKIKYMDLTGVIYPTEGGSNLETGDTFITKFAFRQTYFGYVPHAGNFSGEDLLNLRLLFSRNTDSDGYSDHLSTQNLIAAGTDCNSVFESKIINTWYESEFNDARMSGQEVWNNTFFEDKNGQTDPMEYNPANVGVRTQLFYPKYYGDKGRELLTLELNSNSLSRLTDDGEWKHYQLFPNYYKTEPFYHIYSPNFRAIPLQDNRCNTGLFPNRVIWSEKSNNEERKDRYRTFLGNNYIDIEGNAAYITDVFELNANLYLHTKESMYRLPKTSETLELGNTSATIGVGTYLGIPPQRLGNTNYNYAGNSGRFNRFTTELGVLFANQEQGMVYMFNDQLKSISDNIQQWFYENLPSDLNSYWKVEFGENYSIIDSNARYGVGLTSTFDAFHHRWILHKRDFKPLLPVSFTQESGKIWYDDLVFKNDNGDEIEFTDADYFENKSWTLSYSIDTGSWVSYHSYHPQFMYCDGTTFYSVAKLYNKVWSHNNKTTRSYYDTYRPAIIEWQTSRDKAVTDSLNYILRVQSYDTNLKRWIDVSGDFSRGFLYNTYQTTGMFNIVNQPLFLWSNTNKAVKVRENVHSINGFRQMNDDSLVLTSNWNDLKVSYVGYEPYRPTPIQALTYYQMNKIRDIYCNARLYFETNGKRIRVQLLQSGTTKSIR